MGLVIGGVATTGVTGGKTQNNTRVLRSRKNFLVPTPVLFLPTPVTIPTLDSTRQFYTSVQLSALSNSRHSSCRRNSHLPLVSYPALLLPTCKQTPLAGLVANLQMATWVMSMWRKREAPIAAFRRSAATTVAPPIGSFRFYRRPPSWPKFPERQAANGQSLGDSKKGANLFKVSRFAIRPFLRDTDSCRRAARSATLLNKPPATRSAPTCTDSSAGKPARSRDSPTPTPTRALASPGMRTLWYAMD